MKTLILALILALPVTAAEIQITVRNDAGAVVSDVTLTTNDDVLQAINDWRLDQVIQPEVRDGEGNIIAEEQLRFPTVNSLWRYIIGSFVRNHLADRLPSVQEKATKVRQAQKELEQVKDTVIQ